MAQPSRTPEKVGFLATSRRIRCFVGGGMAEPSPAPDRQESSGGPGRAWQAARALVRSGFSSERREGPVSPSVLFVLALLAIVLVAGLLGRLWKRDEQRNVERKWQERERLLDRRRPIATRREILRRRLRPRRRAHRRGPNVTASRGGRRSGRR